MFFIRCRVDQNIRLHVLSSTPGSGTGAKSAIFDCILLMTVLQVRNHTNVHTASMQQHRTARWRSTYGVITRSQSAQTRRRVMLSMFVVNVACSLNSMICTSVMMRSNTLMTLELCSPVHLWAVGSQLLPVMLTTLIALAECIRNICCYALYSYTSASSRWAVPLRSVPVDFVRLGALEHAFRFNFTCLGGPEH